MNSHNHNDGNDANGRYWNTQTDLPDRENPYKNDSHDNEEENASNQGADINIDTILAQVTNDDSAHGASDTQPKRDQNRRLNEVPEESGNIFRLQIERLEHGVIQARQAIEAPGEYDGYS